MEIPKDVKTKAKKPVGTPRHPKTLETVFDEDEELVLDAIELGMEFEE